MELNRELDAIQSHVEVKVSPLEVVQLSDVEIDAEIETLNQSRLMLNGLSDQLLSGPLWPWALMRHASEHVDRRISKLYEAKFAEEPVFGNPGQR